MKKVKSSVRRMGFTLIEMLVVLGILGILIAALLPMIGGSRDSALKAKCQNNMRNLAQAVHSWAQARSDNLGHLPAAGFYRSVDHTSRKILYYPHRPWISNKGSISMLNSSTASVFLGDIAHFTDSEMDCRNAVTNGAIWHAVGAAFEVYRCPVHARAFEQKHNRQPGWSYMMNQEFGYNQDGGNSAIAFFGATLNANITVATTSTGYRKNGQASRNPDKVLMFAEVQGLDIDDSKHGVSLKALLDGGGTQTDAVLEYTKEDMGFNHPLGKHKYGGNVAFADGHVETIVMPTKMKARDLTRYLCQGYDVPHDGSAYTPNENDR
ncbi:MAG: type II secretion system protein [Kiritimatiellae bacterium]|nr:type II secretion system protein [Kiritimatiellia bacterium]